MQEIDEVDIPMAPIKRHKKNQKKITRRNRLSHLFDEDATEEDEETDNDKWV